LHLVGHFRILFHDARKYEYQNHRTEFIVVVIIVVFVVVVLGVGVAQSVKLLRHELEKLFLPEARVLSPQEPSSNSGDNPMYLFARVPGDFS